MPHFRGSLGNEKVVPSRLAELHDADEPGDDVLQREIGGRVDEEERNVRQPGGWSCGAEQVDPEELRRHDEAAQDQVKVSRNEREDHHLRQRGRAGLHPLNQEEPHAGDIRRKGDADSEKIEIAEVGGGKIEASDGAVSPDVNRRAEGESGEDENLDNFHGGAPAYLKLVGNVRMDSEAVMDKLAPMTVPAESG